MKAQKRLTHWLFSDVEKHKLTCKPLSREEAGGAANVIHGVLMRKPFKPHLERYEGMIGEEEVAVEFRLTQPSSASKYYLKPEKEPIDLEDINHLLVVMNNVLVGRGYGLCKVEVEPDYAVGMPKTIDNIIGWWVKVYPTWIDEAVPESTIEKKLEGKLKPLFKKPTDEDVYKVLGYTWRHRDDVVKALTQLGFTKTDSEKKLNEMIKKGKLEVEYPMVKRVGATGIGLKHPSIYEIAEKLPIPEEHKVLFTDVIYGSHPIWGEIQFPVLARRLPGGKLQLKSPETPTVTILHEYGHQVWDFILKFDDKKEFRKIYAENPMKACPTVEEAFAEAYAWFFAKPELRSRLKNEYPAYYEFMNKHWRLKVKAHLPWQSWIQPVLEYVTEKQRETGIVKEEDVIKEFINRGASEDDIEKAIRQLLREGTLYSPRPEFLRKT